MKFLGEVGSQDVERVGRALLRAAEAGPRFSLRLAECGCFPQRGPVRIVWSRAEEVSGALDTCVEAVETELATLGFLRENRPFAAHITLGRVREDRTAGRMRTIVEQHSGEVVEQEISSLTLMSSVLSPQGARYEAIQRVKLGA